MDAPPPPPSNLLSTQPLESSNCHPNDEMNNAEYVCTASTVDSASYRPHPAVSNPLSCSGPTEENPENRKKMKAKKRIFKDASVNSSSSENRKKMKAKKRIFKDASVYSSSSSSSCYPLLGSSQRGTRVACKRRIPRVVIGSTPRNPIADSIAFRLGMSIAAFVAQILEREDIHGETLTADHLAMICASAVKESLANDFGDAFDSFVKNFETSFGSTLRTLKLIKNSSVRNGKNETSYLKVESSTSDMGSERGDHTIRGSCTSSSGIEDCNSEAILHRIEAHNQLSNGETTKQTDLTDFTNLELSLLGQTNQVATVSRTPFGSFNNQSMMSTIERSVMEQARNNDLKTLEIGLTMKNLLLKETKLGLHLDSNHLERSKLAMGISKASFKAEKFKTQLEDTRHAELHRKCIDFLVGGLIVMVAFLLYGAYVYSYERLSEATASCTPSEKESSSWWIPKPMASLNSVFHIISCQVRVVSRMLFGVFMIVAIAYLLVQRSATAKQTMPITFILLLLGFVCGIAGKLCIETLGGSGSHWLLYWEILCLVHFFSNVFTSTLFCFLYGPVTVSQSVRVKAVVPYWIRQCMFFASLLLFPPLFCGLLPFATFGEWKDHFLLLLTDSTSDF